MEVHKREYNDSDQKSMKNDIITQIPQDSSLTTFFHAYNLEGLMAQSIGRYGIIRMRIRCQRIVKRLDCQIIADRYFLHIYPQFKLRFDMCYHKIVVDHFYG